MKIKYILDNEGNILPAEQFLEREYKEWTATFRLAFKECGDTGKEFIEECGDTVTEFAKERGG
jgi:hypothetical protein